MPKKRRKARDLEEMKSPEVAEQRQGPPTMSGFMSLPLFVILASDYACIALWDWGVVCLLHRTALNYIVPF